MLSNKEKLYLLLNSLVEKCSPYAQAVNGAECPSFIYSSINSFLRDCLLNLIDIPDEDEGPSKYSDYVTSDINPQTEFINLVSEFKFGYTGRKYEVIIYFPEIVLTPELKEIITDNNKVNEFENKASQLDNAI